MIPKRFKRAEKIRKVKIALLSIGIAGCIWGMTQCSIDNQMAQTMETEYTPKIIYIKAERPACNGIIPTEEVHTGKVVKVTAYCGCEECCGEYGANRTGVVKGAAGVPLVPQYSIAADINEYSFGDIVYIDNKEYRVDDVGGAIKGNRIDVYFDSHSEALKFGSGYQILKEVRE